MTPRSVKSTKCDKEHNSTAIYMSVTFATRSRWPKWPWYLQYPPEACTYTTSQYVIRQERLRTLKKYEQQVSPLRAEVFSSTSKLLDVRSSRSFDIPLFCRCTKCTASRILHLKLKAVCHQTECLTLLPRCVWPSLRSAKQNINVTLGHKCVHGPAVSTDPYTCKDKRLKRKWVL